jgi:hypothetical protein
MCLDYLLYCFSFKTIEVSNGGQSCLDVLIGEYVGKLYHSANVFFSKAIAVLLCQLLC